MSKSKGYVYALSNKSLSGMIKIGMTSRSPHDRCRELSASTACPTEFFVLACAMVDNASLEESIFHDDLGEFRVNRSREFFRCRDQRWAAYAFASHPRATKTWVCDKAAPWVEFLRDGGFVAWEPDDEDPSGGRVFVAPPFTPQGMPGNNMASKFPGWPWARDESRGDWLRANRGQR